MLLDWQHPKPQAQGMCWACLLLLASCQPLPWLASIIQARAVQLYSGLHEINESLQQCRKGQCLSESAGLPTQKSRHQPPTCRSRLPRCSSDSLSNLRARSTRSCSNSGSCHGMAAVLQAEEACTSAGVPAAAVAVAAAAAAAALHS